MPRPGGFYCGWVIFFDLVADEGYGGQIWKSFLWQIRQRRFSGLEGGVICGGGGLVGGGFPEACRVQNRKAKPQRPEACRVRLV